MPVIRARLGSTGHLSLGRARVARLYTRGARVDDGTMDGWLATAAGIAFFWTGVVVAISFIEAPLKFRAPGITVPLGLGIGRLVFRAVNALETVLAVVIVVALVVGSMGPATWVPLAIAVAALVLQLVAVRPALTKRSDAVLAGEDAPRSHAHLAY